MAFEDFNLHPSVMSGVRALGYVTPTPIQERAIPAIMQGRDLIGQAQTGTGKTAAFMLPILHRLMQGTQGRVRALIISPTRELAEQTCQAAHDLGKFTKLQAVSVYGGVSADMQKRKLRQGSEIVVACPGRLLDLMYQGALDLSDVDVLVIDEADQMFDMGFLPDVRSILKCLLKPHQTMLFSATMPDDIRRLVKEVLHDPITVQVGRSAPATSVSHAVYPVSQHLKTGLLKEILRKTQTESVLVFTRTKHRATSVAEQLARAGFNAKSLQGNLSQGQRQAAIDAFRSGRLKVLVATDIAARGIDISRISHVINYDMPDTTDAYTHRIGRTGRVDKTGEAFTFVTNEDIATIRAVERVLNATLERRMLEGFDYGTPAPPSTDHAPRTGFARPGMARRSGSGSDGAHRRPPVRRPAFAAAH
ncbi:MAG: DEAD/DEAH box helicase [Dehalococcoidia bacterium]|nr:DEAD/DEAH box helicase [Dehalococcoidia bacterium]